MTDSAFLTEIKALLHSMAPTIKQAIAAKTGDLATLATTAKTSLVAAINEVATAIGSRSTTGSAGSLKSPVTTGVLTATGMGTGATRVKTVRDADDTLIELGGSYTPNGTWNWTYATVTWPTFNQDTSGTAGKATNLKGGNNTILLGAIPYQSNTDATTLLAPNTASTKKFLRQTGTGTNGAAPAWDTLVIGDLPTVTPAKGGTGVANGANNTITFTGNYTLGLTLSANTTVTLPTSGTLLNSTDTAAKATILATARAIYGNNFDGSAALAGIIASTYGGTGNGFTKFSGPTTAERTFTLPDASSTLLYSGGALGTPSGGTLTNCTFPTLNQDTSGTAAKATNLKGGNNTTLLGAIPYQSDTDATTLLAPNVTTTKKFLRQTGTGTNGAAPAWDTLVIGDLPVGTTAGTVAAGNDSRFSAIAPPSFKNGGLITWLSTASVKVGPLALWIPGANAVLESAADITLTGISLGANTWGYLYAYSNAGTLAIEVSTTAPASPYSGTARCKTGDTSRRLVGWVRANASNQLRPFYHKLPNEFCWTNMITGDIVSNGISTTKATVGVTAFIPPESTLIKTKGTNWGLGNCYLNSNDFSPLASAATFIETINGANYYPSTIMIDIPTDSSRRIAYAYSPSPGINGLYLNSSGFYGDT